MVMPAWPDDQVERLRALWNEGLSAAQIAYRLNSEFLTAHSRNAVIGVVHRRGFQGRAKPSKPTVHRTRPTSPPKPKLVRERVRVGGNCQTYVEPPPRPSEYEPKVGAFDPLPLSNPRPFSERPRSGCRWPVGGDGADMLACCLPSDGGPYCAKHHKRGTVPTSKPHELARSVRKWVAA